MPLLVSWKKIDGVGIHVRTLKRKLKELGLKRRGCNYDEDLLRGLIKLEMQGAGSLAGYRYIWHSLRLIKTKFLSPRTEGDRIPYYCS